MNNNMIIPGLKDVIIHEIKGYLDCVAIHVSLAKKEQVCPSCGVKTSKVHDYRIQKVKRLKWFERLTIFFISVLALFVFVESDFRKPTFVDSYQRFPKEKIGQPSYEERFLRFQKFISQICVRISQYFEGISQICDHISQNLNLISQSENIY